jgi:3-hydroxybutyryl-CoA dehydrogenase
MNVLIRGNESHIAEFKAKFSDLPFDTDIDHASKVDLSTYEYIFDFDVDNTLENPESYTGYSGTLLLNSVKYSLIGCLNSADFELATLVGFNGLPTFFNRDVLECTVMNQEGSKKLKEVAGLLNFTYVSIEDRIGMVTPRVVFMIINEAFFTVQEGTATRDDIDLAMKLGTNYPYGPFEWVKKIGISNVYEILEAIYQDTRDDRYKICPLLKREYLVNTPSSGVGKTKT